MKYPPLHRWKCLLHVVLITASLIWLTPSCKQRQSTASSSSNGTSELQLQDSLLVSIRRGACFGRCPEYEASIYKSGFAEYKGVANVKKLGTWTTRLSPEQLKEMVALIRESKMEEKDSAYVNKYLADFPAYYLWIADLKPRRQILVNHEAPPEQISEFTSLLDKLLESLQWRPMGPAPKTDRE